MGNPFVAALTAHNQSSLGGDPDRQIYFSFENLEFVAGDAVAIPLQPVGRNVAYLYRDAGVNYFPLDPTDEDDASGAYLNGTFVDLEDNERAVEIADVIDAFVHIDGENNPNNLSAAESQTVFNRIFPNPDTYQLISFGLDGIPGGPTTCPPAGDGTELVANPNVITRTCAAGADNFVNFGGGGITKLETVLEELN